MEKAPIRISDLPKRFNSEMRGIDVQALAIGLAYEEFHAVAGGANARLKLLAHATLKTSKTTIRKKTQRERRCMTTPPRKCARLGSASPSRHFNFH